MSAENWIALGMLAVGGLGCSGSVILYAMKLIREVGEIAANTRHTADRLNTVAQDNVYIREKVDETAERVVELSMRTERLESSVDRLNKASTS